MPDEVATERHLYAATHRFLDLAFPGLLGARIGGAQPQLFSDIVAARPTSGGGRWTRPDLACVAISRGHFVPYLTADLHTFEVKTVAGLDEMAVHEAHAHGRFGQYAWLVFPAVGQASPDEPVWRRVENQATHLGVGLIYFVDQDAPLDWRIAAWPRRTGSDLAIADRFVSERFSDDVKERIAHQLAAMGWPR